LDYAARRNPGKGEAMRKLVLMLIALALLPVSVSAAPALPAAKEAAKEKEVLAALDLWKAAMMKKDRATFEKVFHPDLTFGHSSGLVETKAQAIEHVVAGAASFDAIDLAETKVRLQGNTALVTGKMDYHQRENGKVQLVGLVVLTVWVKGAPGWQMIARQAAKPAPAAAATPAAAVMPAAAAAH
jgi:ketosteroid isomerase-like protein